MCLQSPEQAVRQGDLLLAWLQQVHTPLIGGRQGQGPGGQEPGGGGGGWVEKQKSRKGKE